MKDLNLLVSALKAKGYDVKIITLDNERKVVAQDIANQFWHCGDTLEDFKGWL